jgi:hypothetical protein
MQTPAGHTADYNQSIIEAVSLSLRVRETMELLSPWLLEWHYCASKLSERQLKLELGACMHVSLEAYRLQ